MICAAWYAVEWRTNISSTPQRFQIAGKDIVVFETTHHELRAFGAWCPHRGCDLSLGTVKDDCLICAYHGWQFDGTGACVTIPANKRNANIPRRFRLQPYAVREYAGLVYVCLAESEEAAPPFKIFPELTDNRYAGASLSVTWDAHFSRVVESVLDVSHLPFVHPETMGTDYDPAVIGPDLTVRSDGMSIYPMPFAPAHPLQPVEVPAGVGARTEIELIFPNHWIIRTPVGVSNFFITYLTFTPTEDEQTRIFGLAIRNFDTDDEWIDEFHLNHTEFVMKQDQEIVERLYPKQAPFNLQLECHVPSDAPTIHFRKMLREAVRREAWEA